jgi:hypothetical protein
LVLVETTPDSNDPTTNINQINILTGTRALGCVAYATPPLTADTCAALLARAVPPAELDALLDVALSDG